MCCEKKGGCLWKLQEKATLIGSSDSLLHYSLATVSIRVHEFAYLRTYFTYFTILSCYLHKGPKYHEGEKPGIATKQQQGLVHRKTAYVDRSR